jgi:hypothetical protein
MRGDYKFNGPTGRIEVDVEKEVAEKIRAMEKYAGLSVSELVNTALKRFIVHHSDFLPPADTSKTAKRA